MIFAALVAASFAAAQPAPAAPAPAAVRTVPGVPLEFQSVDGWALHAVWKQADEGKPTLILLAGTGQRKEVWRYFARALTKAGLGYAALDMRGHGDSRTTPEIGRAHV